MSIFEEAMRNQRNEDLNGRKAAQAAVQSDSPFKAGTQSSLLRPATQAPASLEESRLLVEALKAFAEGKPVRCGILEFDGAGRIYAVRQGRREDVTNLHDIFKAQAQKEAASPIDQLKAAASAKVNPKQAAGMAKSPTGTIMPTWFDFEEGHVMSIGAHKYGAFNYREASIEALTYYDAMKRHIELWFDGEDNDPETGVSHLASVAVNCKLLRDCQEMGTLIDNRQKTGLVRKCLDRLDALRKTLPILQTPKKG